MGALTRTVRISARQGEVRAAIEDDFHHFRVTLYHDAETVTGVEGETLRRPWSTCLEAAGQLSRLVGMALSTCASSVAQHTDRQFQCTHLFDLAGLAVAVATRGTSSLRYDMRVNDSVDGERAASISRNGQVVLEWMLHQTRIVSPSSYLDRDLRLNFADWAQQSLPEDESEAALALRRAVFISNGRKVDLDRLSHPPATAGCFTLQPDRALQAVRMVGSTFDFSHRAEMLTQSDEIWLGFA
ncbi:MAG: hypothetical protein JWQ69_3117 [Pseudomonas sp.]|nr:hypothetical protein [Pseudomonas sp.]